MTNMSQKQVDIDIDTGVSAAAAAAEKTAARRRMQNRIAQRNHRERCRQNTVQRSKKTINALVWTQPHTIPRPPVKSRDERRQRQVQRQQEQTKMQEWPLPQPSPQTPPTSSRRHATPVAQMTPRSPTLPEQQHQQHQKQQPRQQVRRDSTQATQADAQVPYTEHHDSGGSVLAADMGIHWMDPTGPSPTEQQRPTQVTESKVPCPEFDKGDATFSDNVHWLETKVLGHDSAFDHMADIIELQHLISPPTSKTNTSPPDYFGPLASPTCNLLFSVPDPSQADGASWDWMGTAHANGDVHEMDAEAEGDSDADGEADADGDAATAEVSGYNALHLAVYHGKSNIVQLLLKLRPEDANTSTSHGQSALHIAAANYHVEIVRLLLDNGADLKLQDDFGRTPLHTAVMVGAQAVVQLLLSRQTHVSVLQVRDLTGCTPLHAAVMLGYEDIVRLLLNQGADPATVVMTGMARL